MSVKNLLFSPSLFALVLVLFAHQISGCSETPLDVEDIDSLEGYITLSEEDAFTWAADGLTVSFNSIVDNGQKYRWDFGDSQFSSDANPVHTYKKGGTYTITYTVQTSADKMRNIQSILVSGGGGIIPPDPIGSTEIPGGDTSEPVAIDTGDLGTLTPGTYKGLPLRLQDNGEPVVSATNGKIGVVCIGMSNAAQECGYYISSYLPKVMDEINPEVEFVNCAVGGNAIERWIDPARDGILWQECIDKKLPQAGLTVDQIKVIYHKAANMFTGPDPGVDAAYPPYPDANSDYFRFYNNLDEFAGRVKSFFPNVQAVYTTSRSFGGFADKSTRGEPVSYEEGHALNTWLQDNESVDGAWYGWGAYIWAPDCASGNLNLSNVCYVAGDFQSDGTHPGPGAKDKIGNMIHNHFLQHSWYTR